MTDLTIAAPGGPIHFGNELPLAFILGPCALESRDHALTMATAMAALSALELMASEEFLLPLAERAPCG